ncbi:LysE family translocator [Vineibacter terrae]|uniref:LysE family translocator n=1 Tax=Vineibacter terrae TaxID=2586908 RepID=UPI0015B687AA|nr:LysE family transporter [Vineibacter terrae]HEX2887949.1 LysE family transporter [Vineibacter terrae]
MLLDGIDPIYLGIEGAVIGFLIALPIGPAGILCIQRAISHGPIAGYATGIGAAIGDAVFGGMAAFGLSFVAEFIEHYEVGIRAIGGALLMWMGWSYYKHRPRTIGDPVAADRAHPYWTYLHYLSSSFFITIFNPITVMAFGAVFAGRGLSNVGSDMLAATILIAGVLLGALGWWATLVLISSAARGWFVGGGLIWLNRVSGAALGGFGLLAVVSALPVNWTAVRAAAGLP